MKVSAINYDGIEDGFMDFTVDEYLEPCPFCGNSKPRGRIYFGQDGFRDRYAILCHYFEPGCGAESGHYHTMQEAIDSWNRRTPQP